MTNYGRSFLFWAHIRECTVLFNRGTSTIVKKQACMWAVLYALFYMIRLKTLQKRFRHFHIDKTESLKYITAYEYLRYGLYVSYKHLDLSMWLESKQKQKEVTTPEPQKLTSQPIRPVKEFRWIFGSRSARFASFTYPPLNSSPWILHPTPA